MAIIEVQNVTKTFGSKVALDHVSLDIPEGKIFGLLGPNGAGKSTLIRIINRITIASEGQILFQGHPITENDVAQIGYLPEFYYPCVYLIALENRASAGLLGGGWGGATWGRALPWVLGRSRGGVGGGVALAGWAGR